MNHILIILAILAVSAVASAKGVVNDKATIQTSTYPDGILFDVRGIDVDFDLTVSGPGNYIFTQRSAYAESVFLDIKNVDGKRLADGLYKYEAKPMPTVVISREESSKMRDRNVLHGKSDAKISPFSGTFRIVNGTMIDPELGEYDTPVVHPTRTEQ